MRLSPSSWDVQAVPVMPASQWQRRTREQAQTCMMSYSLSSDWHLGTFSSTLQAGATHVVKPKWVAIGNQCGKGLGHREGEIGVTKTICHTFYAVVIALVWTSAMTHAEINVTHTQRYDTPTVKLRVLFFFYFRDEKDSVNSRRPCLPYLRKDLQMKPMNKMFVEQNAKK